MSTFETLRSTLQSAYSWLQMPGPTADFRANSMALATQHAVNSYQAFATGQIDARRYEVELERAREYYNEASALPASRLDFITNTLEVIGLASLLATPLLTSATGLSSSARFAQLTNSENFSAEGIAIYSTVAGRPINTIDDLAAAIRSGAVSVDDIPINVITRDGFTLIANTRTYLALERAGIPRSQMKVINQTGDELFDGLVSGQLRRNGLTSEGTPYVYPNPRCFLAGTPVTMADGSEKPIEEIKIGDMVMAFDEFANNGMGKLVPQRVTRTMQGTTTEVVDLRGLRVTPGHRFLSDAGAWLAIEKILKDDGVIVEQRPEGPVQVRARTGAAVGSVEDILVPVVFVDKATRCERIAHVRAGIPCLGRKGANGTVEIFNLYRITAHHGGKILPDGRSVDQDGIIGDYLGWPEGVSPLDATYMHDWIVKLDGQPFTPQWIADVGDADEGRQAINGTPVMRSPGRSSRATFTHAFSPAVIQGGGKSSGPNRKARRKQAALTRVK